jgi:hypothetical protein
MDQLVTYHGKMFLSGLFTTTWLLSIHTKLEWNPHGLLVAHIIHCTSP